MEANSKAYHTTSNDTRQRIIAASLAGTDAPTIATCFSVNPWTVRRILDKYRATGRADKEKQGGYKPSLLHEEHCAFLRELMAEDATVTLERMQEQFWAVSGLNVSVATIHRAIVGFAYSFKVMKVQVRAAVTEAALAARRDYSRWLMETVIHNKNTVYVHEVGFTVVSRVNRGRAKVGEAARIVKPLIRSRNISVMAAIARSGVVHYEILDGHGNSERFRQFLHGLQEHCQELGIGDAVVIMDNFPILLSKTWPFWAWSANIYLPTHLFLTQSRIFLVNGKPS